MKYPIVMVQRVGIDCDEEHGEEAGEGAALVELAALVTELELPFVPFPGLTIRSGSASLVLEEVVWEHERRRFVCEAEKVWMQTKASAESIVESLVEAGFRPLDPHHRGQDVH